MSVRPSIADVLAAPRAAGVVDVASTLSQLAMLALAGPTKLDRFAISRALSGRGVDSTPFAWSAANAHRSVALGALRRCLSGPGEAPLDAVRGEVGRLAVVGRRDPVDPRSLPCFLAEASEGELAALTERATNLATEVLVQLPWAAFGSRPVVGPVLEPITVGRLTLRARADVELVDETGSTLLLVLPGSPALRAVDELAYVALVAALDQRRSPAVQRVVGWWPSSGELREVVLGPGALATALEAVACALRGQQASAA